MIQRIYLILIFLCFHNGSSCQPVVNFVKSTFTFYYDVLPVQVAYCSTKGFKPYQQDTMLIQDKLIAEKGGILIKTEGHLLIKPLLFGVFDGHSSDNRWNYVSYRRPYSNDGYEVSHYAAQQTQERFKKNKDIPQLLKTLNQDLFKQRYAQEAGSTACIVTVNTNATSTVYNLGDSRALWGVGEDEHTRDHSVENKDEVARVQPLGFSVEEKYFGKKLAVSRVLGDCDLSLYNTGSKNGFVSDEAEVYALGKKQHLFIGCDGCFNYTENEKIWLLYKTLLQKNKSLDQIAWYILYYIIRSIIEKDKYTLQKAIDDPSNEMNQELFDTLMDTKEYHSFATADITTLDIQHVEKYCNIGSCKLHDNTSFILLNIGDKPEQRFWLLNKERAIILFLLVAGISGKYFLYK